VERPHAYRPRGGRRVRIYEYRQRELRFANSPAATRAQLRRLGTELPAPPASRSIPTDGCAASIGIESRGSGSALVCKGWC